MNLLTKIIRFDGLRKVAIVSIVFATSCIMLALDVINADQFVELNKYVIPSFMAANMMEYWMERRRGRSHGPFEPRRDHEEGSEI